MHISYPSPHACPQTPHPKGQRSGPSSSWGALAQENKPTQGLPRGHGPQARATALPHPGQLLLICPGARGLACRCSSSWNMALGFSSSDSRSESGSLIQASRSRLWGTGVTWWLWLAGPALDTAVPLETRT